MAGNVAWFLRYNLIAECWIKPKFLFKYYGFSWVQPWPGNWLYIHWAVLGLLALFIAAGFLYRASTVAFFLSYSYFFLLDQARYVNHTYLISLFSFLLIFVPAHRAFSIDAWLNPKLRSDTAPIWALAVLRTQMGGVYFFSGLAKFSPDWLHGEPMRAWLALRPGFGILGRFAREEWFVYATSYGAMFLDLFIVPLLLWRVTRLATFCLAAAFHLINSQVFEINIFPGLLSRPRLSFSPQAGHAASSLYSGDQKHPRPL